MTKTNIEANDARTDMVGEFARRYDTGRHDPFDGMRDFYRPVSGWWIVGAGVAILVVAAVAAELLKASL